MELTFDGSVVHAGHAAREQFYDARGYGQPRGGDLELAPVEAAHLLFRGDIDAVRDRRPGRDGERLGFQELLASAAVSEVAFLVYADLRERGFYLSPRGERDAEPSEDSDADRRGFVVYPRGQGPWDETAAYRVWAVSEREDVTASAIQSLARRARQTDATGVLAVVDEESEVTYLSVAESPLEGSTHHDLPTAEGLLLSDRVLVADPPDAFHERAFYGQPLGDDTLQLSLVEAAHLADRNLLTLRETPETGDASRAERDTGAVDDHDADSDYDAVLSRGRAVEGERFDRRLRVYTALRDSGVVPKTGFKFGADFRTYADVDSVENLGHSEHLVRVLPATHTFAPRDLALDVRLAHGVRKQMAFALTDGGVDWLSVERLTP